MEQKCILKVSNLKQYFLLKKNHIIKAVDDISFQIHKGEIFGLVGETGCGKSTVARTVMGMYQASGGEVFLNGIRISDRKEYRSHKKEIQTKLQIIFQDSAASLDPRMTVEELVAEPMRINKVYTKKEELKKEVLSLMDQVGLDADYREKYPGELSGGQRQRVAIARAISIKPDLIVADEPIASLDVSIQAQIVNLFMDLQKKQGFSFLFIAHDLSVVRFISDTIGVMRKGKLVEIAPTEELFHNPLHPYTRSLLDAVPTPDPVYERKKVFMEYCESDYTEQDVMEEVIHNHLVRKKTKKKVKICKNIPPPGL
ncbi:MAG: ATP-binding cassette domain-containing protein [Lachnospiraceae bacterium]|nr:ATP-binding cassette domain-containing protein [Lachnospiraceae bacterium]